MKITRLVIKSYRGIAALDTSVGGGATIAHGANGAGKTTVLRALRAALAGNDIGADAIRHGADSAEILVDLDDVSVRRAISRKGASLTVERDGFKAQKPQTFLNELLGTSPLDPLDLLLLKPKERRARILEALPCKVTREQLVTWAPTLPRHFDIPEGEHGLETVERARKLFYDKRAEANAKAKESAGTAARALDAMGGPVATPEALDVATAAAALETAKREDQRLGLRADEARAHEERSVATREKIATKRRAAATLREQAPRTVDAGPVEDALARSAENVASIRRSLEVALDAHKLLEDELKVADAANTDHANALLAAEHHEKGADELEATLAAGVQAPTDEEREAVAETLRCANVDLAQAKGAEAIAVAKAEVARLDAVAAADASAADELDVVVKALANDAPKALATGDAIPGLTLDGDEVVFDGKRLDALCGAEQMRLCVEIAKRANRSGFVVVDGLERLDPEQFAAFVREVTHDGTQLIGTRVARGELTLEHLAGDTDDAEAAQ